MLCVERCVLCCKLKECVCYKVCILLPCSVGGDAVAVAGESSCCIDGHRILVQRLPLLRQERRLLLGQQPILSELPMHQQPLQRERERRESLYSEIYNLQQ